MKAWEIVFGVIASALILWLLSSAFAHQREDRRETCKALYESARTHTDTLIVDLAKINGTSTTCYEAVR